MPNFNWTGRMYHGVEHPPKEAVQWLPETEGVTVTKRVKSTLHDYTVLLVFTDNARPTQCADVLAEDARAACISALGTHIPKLFDLLWVHPRVWIGAHPNMACTVIRQTGGDE